jgi:hypothetical protein
VVDFSERAVIRLPGFPWDRVPVAAGHVLQQLIIPGLVAGKGDDVAPCVGKGDGGQAGVLPKEACKRPADRCAIAFRRADASRKNRKRRIDAFKVIIEKTGRTPGEKGTVADKCEENASDVITAGTYNVQSSPGTKRYEPLKKALAFFIK